MTEQETQGHPLSFGRGGPAMWSGASFHGLIARAELLSMLDRTAGAIALEPRVITSAGRQVGFDLLVDTACPTFVEVKLRPTQADIRAFLRACLFATQVTADDAIFLLVHDQEAPCTRELSELTKIAEESSDDAAFRGRVPARRSVDTVLEILGASARLTLRRVSVQLRPKHAEERLALATARHLVLDRARSTLLLDCLGSMVEQAGRARATIQLADVRTELDQRGIELAVAAALPRDLVDDALNRADRRCCVCHRRGTPVDVRLINTMESDHDPDNLVVLCASCFDASQAAAAQSPSLEAERLVQLRRAWDWRVAQDRRSPHISQTVGSTPPHAALAVLRAHLIEDFHWDGPRRGEFARLGGRMEDRFYQSSRGELLTARPAYYHTYWGLVGSRLILAEQSETYEQIAADAVVSRLAASGWVTVDLEDYNASPTIGRRRVETIRHTARAVTILHLLGRHLELASEVAWAIVAEADASLLVDGWREFRYDPSSRPSLYTDVYVYQMLSMLLSDPEWMAAMPESTAFRDAAIDIAQRTLTNLLDRWQDDRWEMNAMPWEVNAAAMIADIGPHLPDGDREEIASCVLRAFGPAGRLVVPNAGDEFDAPEVILSLRLAFALVQLGVRRSDERLASVIGRLLRQDWQDAPLRTMDAAFLAQIIVQDD